MANFKNKNIEEDFFNSDISFVSDKIKENTNPKEEFLQFKRVDLYKPFDNLFGILDKKILIEDKQSIDVWEESVDNKIDKCVRDIDNFLEQVTKAKKYILRELKKYYYTGLLREILLLDIDSYLNSPLWEQYEILKKGEEGFQYEDYVNDKYFVYQALVKRDKNKFILILIPKEQEDTNKVVFKRKEVTRYFLLDLTEEYQKYLNIY